MAERRPRSQSLERVLGASALFAPAYGNVSSSIYYALGLVAALALGLTPLVFVIAGLVFYFTATTYIEATTMYPEAGGSSSFARHAFNEFASFVAAWGQLLNYVITAAISAYFVPKYLAVFWEPLGSSPWDVIGGIVIVALLATLNVFGAQESARINVVLSIFDLCTQALIAVVGVLLVLSPGTLVQNVDFGVFPTWPDMLVAIPVAMVAYTGIETLSNLAEEAKDYKHTIPRAGNGVVMAVFVIYSLLPAVALSAMPVTNGETLLATEYAGNPMVGIVKQMGMGSITGVLVMYVGVLAGSILITATNAGLIGVSRLSYSMGQYRQLPRVMSRLHPRFKTPFIAIIFFALTACLAMVPGQAEFLARMYAFGALLSFTIAHVSVIRLRKIEPDAERPWRSPVNIRIRGTSIPLFAVIGGLATALFWFVVVVRDRPTLIVGLGWMIAGVTFYVIFRRRQQLPLTQTRKIVAPKQIVEHEVEYDSILLVFEDGRYSEEAVRTAVKMASRRSRGIHVLVTITVPANASINASLPTDEANAATLIERAREFGGRRVTGHWEKVRAGQGGRRIVAEAELTNARAIVFPLHPSPTGSLFSSAVQHVLSERPCRVILTSEPVRRPAVAA